MHKCSSSILYAACTFRPYKSTPVLKLFRTFTGKMTRGLSLQMVFSLLFLENLEEHLTKKKWSHKLQDIRLTSIINMFGSCFFCPINHVASVFSREINVPVQEKPFFDHFLKWALVSSSII